MQTEPDKCTDMNIEQAYNKLLESWEEQPHPQSANYDAPAGASGLTPDQQRLNSACMIMFDRYLERQWKDSQNMLQCAQAWSIRPRFDQDEAVRTLNIFSLRMMQQSLDARQGLLGLLENSSSLLTLPSPQMTEYNSPSMTSESKSSDIQRSFDRDRVVFRISEDDSCSFNMSSFDEEELHAPLLRRHPNESSLHKLSNERLSEKVLLPDTDPLPSHSQQRRLPTSPSAPNFSSQEAVGSFSIHKNHSGNLLSWKNKLVEDSSSDENYNEEGTWRSWFAPTPSIHAQPLNDEALFDPIMPRSESSISAFRPISKNLAPRCVPVSRSCAESSCSSSSNSSKKLQKWGRKTMTKSRSFPTKIKTKDDSPPLPVGTPKVNAVMRSIVSKKVSLGRLFANKKTTPFDSLE